MQHSFTKAFCCLFFFALTLQVKGQPNWIQESQRTTRYPNATFLTGFSVAKNTQNEAGDEFMNKQVEVARTELINSIYTNLQSLSSLNIENKNTQTNEVYRLKTASFSKASISGLKIEKYYDVNNKTAYAFAYARKKEVIDYNRRLIQENKVNIEGQIQKAERFNQSGNSQQALKAYYEGLTLLRNVETAQSVLLALNIDLTALPYRQEFNQYAFTINQGIEKLQNSSNLKIEDICYFLASGLSLQLGSTNQAIHLQSLYFENKGFESPFSQQIGAQLEKQLINVGKYNIRNSKSKQDNQIPLVIKGSYWLEGDIIRIIAIAENRMEEQTLASAEGKLSVQAIENAEEALVPLIIRKMDQLQNFRLTAVNPRMELKVTEADQSPAVVQVSSDKSISSLAQIPLIFLDPQKGNILSKSRTNNSGRASGAFQGLSPSNQIQFVEAYIDIPSYLNLDEQDPRLKRLLPSIPKEKVRFMLKVSGPSIQIDALESDQYGKALSTPILGPKIKSMLSQNGYSFTEQFTEADLVVNIRANAKAGKNFGGLFFSYIDATISIVDMQAGKEVYSNSFENVKGGAGSYPQATMKAYQAIAETITNDLKAALNLDK